MYAFITSGGNSGNNLFKFIPNSWKIDSYGNGDTIHGYAQYMQDQLDIYKGSSVNDPNMIDIDEIVLNNWYDNRFVPITRIDGWETYSTSKVRFDSSNKPYGIAVPVVIVKPDADIEKFSDDKYIKVRRECSDSESQRNFTVYKAVEYTADGKLIYAMVEPKGNQYKTGDTIYEMRRSDSKRKESAVFAAASKSLSTSIKIAKEAMGVQGTDLAQILEDVIQKIRSKESMPAKEKMVNLFTIDPQLNEWIKSAIPIEDEVVDDSKFLKAARFYNREDVEKDDKTLYIFTDNTDRDSGGGLIDENSWYAKKYGTGHHYPGKTSAVIRGLENAAPISTQRWYHDGAKGETGRWTDEAFDEFKAVIDDEIEQIKSMWRSGKYNKVVYPDLFNSKISNITRERTPQIFEYLTTKIADLEDFINKGVESSRQEAEKTGAKTYKPGEQNNTTIDELYENNIVLESADGVYVPLAKGVRYKFPDSLGGTTWEIDEIITPEKHGSDIAYIRGKSYNRFGEEYQGIYDNPFAYIENTRGITVFAPDGTDITNYMYLPKNDPQRFNTPQEEKETLSSKRTILSNEELKYWNENGVGEMPRILVATERTDAAFNV